MMNLETTSSKPTIAVAIPCYQEALTIGKVVADFRRELPDAVIYVYDNNCTDGTAEIAAAAGAVVRRERRQGKGYVVAAMFDGLTEDILVMVDGDDTYDASHVHKLLEPVLSGVAEMSVATRLTSHGRDSFRPMHVAGNKLVCAIINRVFSSCVTDIFSGYRAFTRECARQIPITSKGFDIETEMTLQALYRGQTIREAPAPYRARPEGSFSKLNTYSDGALVFLRLFLILKSYKPLTLFGGIGLVLGAVAILAGIATAWQMLANPEQIAGQITCAVLTFSLVMMALLSLGIGLILNSINLRLLELERITVRQGRTSGGE
jgi:glycosyltransferase involved in cell wall biosynthesis